MSKYEIQQRPQRADDSDRCLLTAAIVHPTEIVDFYRRFSQAIDRDGTSYLKDLPTEPRPLFIFKQFCSSPIEADASSVLFIFERARKKEKKKLKWPAIKSSAYANSIPTSLLKVLVKKI